MRKNTARGTTYTCDLYGVPCAGISFPQKMFFSPFFPPPVSAEKTSQLLLPVNIETSNKHTQKRIGHKMLFDASDATDDALTAPFRTVPDSGLKLLNPGSVGGATIFPNRPRVEEIYKPERQPASPTFACQQKSLTDENMKILGLLVLGASGPCEIQGVFFGCDKRATCVNVFFSLFFFRCLPVGCLEQFFFRKQSVLGGSV